MNAVGSLSLLSPGRVLPQLISTISASMENPALCQVTREEFAIMKTPEGELYDKSIIQRWGFIISFLSAPVDWSLLASSPCVSGFVRCSFWTGVPGFVYLDLSPRSADPFLCFFFSALNRIAWKRLTWRGRTKLIPSRNRSLSWSWRRWVDGSRKGRCQNFTAVSFVLLCGFWHVCVHSWERFHELLIPVICSYICMY